MKSSEGALFDATGECATEETLRSFSFIDITDCFSDGTIPVEVSQLETGFDDIEGVRQKGTDEPGYGRSKKILVGCHFGLLKVTEAGEV